ncbi:hypothetical protein KD913_09005 [Klebsiella pneumoniae]
MASAKRCQRRERRLLNDIRHVASGLVHLIRHRLQAARAAAEDQFLPVNHAAAIGGFKQHAVRRGGQSAARRSPPGWRRCRWGFTTGARAAACRRLTLAETKKSKGEQYGVGNSIVT